MANIAGRASGGIGEVVHQVVAHQRRAGIDATLWFPGTLEMQHEVEEITGLKDGSVRAFRATRVAGHVVPVGLFAQKSSARLRFDILHQHGIWLPNSLFALSLAAKMPTVISPHGLLEPERLKLSRWKKLLVAAVYENRNLRGAKCLVATANQEAAGFRAYGLRQPIAVVPNGVAEEFFRDHSGSTSDEADLRCRAKLDLDTRVILFLSRIHPLKGADLLIEAVGKLRDDLARDRWALVVAGPDEQGQQARLEALVAARSLGNLVKFVGPLYGSARLGAFRGANFFALPSENENFGIVVAEALASGLPVLASHQMPWKIVDERGCGYWVPRTVEAIQHAIERVIRLSDADRRAMGARGQVLAQASFRWPSIARQLCEVYDWALSDTSHQPCFFDSERPSREQK